MREVEDYMSFRRFPRDLRNRVRDYFERRYRGHVFNEDDILESMSDPLREVGFDVPERALHTGSDDSLFYQYPECF